MLGPSKPDCYPRLPKPNLEILLMYWNILDKFSKQHHTLVTVGRFLHRPKFQVLSAELNVMVKVVCYLPKSEAAVHRCLQPFTEKRLLMSIYFIKGTSLQPKKKTPHRCIPSSMPNISEHFFCETKNTFGCSHLELFLNAIYFLCCVDLISKMLLSTWAMF